MYKTLVLVRRWRESKSFKTHILHKGCIDTDVITKQSTFLEESKRIAQEDVKRFGNDGTWNSFYIIQELPLGETFYSNWKKTTIYWKKDARELLPNKWKKTIKNGRTKWVMINSKQEELFK